MHGSGLTHIVWSLHETFLTTKGYSVLSVDLPGHGSSEGPAIKSIEEISEWIKKSMEKLKIKEISLIFNFSMDFLIHSDISSIDFIAGPSELPCPGKSTDKTL